MKTPRQVVHGRARRAVVLCAYLRLRIPEPMWRQRMLWHREWVKALDQMGLEADRREREMRKR